MQMSSEFSPRESQFPFSFEMRVLMLTPEHAQLAAASLAVDAELQRDRARKAVCAEGCELVARLAAADARLLRVTASSFIDMATTLARTMRDFGY
jgi:hypothetical protein